MTEKWILELPLWARPLASDLLRRAETAEAELKRLKAACPGMCGASSEVKR